MNAEQPQPIPTGHVCSVCGESWEKHRENPDLMSCIRVLKFELHEARKRSTWRDHVPERPQFTIRYKFIDPGNSDAPVPVFT